LRLKFAVNSSMSLTAITTGGKPLRDPLLESDDGVDDLGGIERSVRHGSLPDVDVRSIPQQFVDAGLGACPLVDPLDDDGAGLVRPRFAVFAGATG
jgi:hypothetical protein